jgi:hypothetical protein
MLATANKLPLGDGFNPIKIVILGDGLLIIGFTTSRLFFVVAGALKC